MVLFVYKYDPTIDKRNSGRPQRIRIFDFLINNRSIAKENLQVLKKFSLLAAYIFVFSISAELALPLISSLMNG